MLIDHTWKLKYTPEDGDLVQVFYVPALQDAARYDRLTGYFDAGALALAARGVEGLVRNDGRMRLVVGCTLKAPEIEAINKGEALRDQVERRLVEQPLAPPDAAAVGALELLAWMIGHGYLDVKVAVPCDAAGRPVNDTAIFTRSRVSSRTAPATRLPGPAVSTRRRPAGSATGRASMCTEVGVRNRNGWTARSETSRVYGPIVPREPSCLTCRMPPSRICCGSCRRISPHA